MAGSAALLLALLLQTVPQSGGYVIFESDKTAEMLRQCSRATPKPGEGGWMPSAKDIAKLEAKLPGALRVAALNAYAHKELQGAPKGWIRQYVGIVRGGKHFVYGNFVPAGGNFTSGWRGQPINICDGGPALFGAEYDVEMDAISHLAFNGVG